VVYNLGDIAWMIAATALVWIMIPGVGYFYSGLLRRKNALSMIWLSMMTLAVVSFQVSLHSFISCTVDLHLFCSGSFGGQYADAAATRLVLKVLFPGFPLHSVMVQTCILGIFVSQRTYSRLHTH
jgi:ammonia channel protein AmtB